MNSNAPIRELELKWRPNVRPLHYLIFSVHLFRRSYTPVLSFNTISPPLWSLK